MLKKISLTLVALFILLPVREAQADYFLSPSSINFEASAGGRYQKLLLLKHDGSAKETVYEFKPSAEIDSWVYFDRKEIKLRPGESAVQVLVSFKLPTDIKEGFYEGEILVKERPEEAGLTIIKEKKIKVTVNVVDAVQKVRVEELKIADFEKGSQLVTKIKISNQTKEELKVRKLRLFVANLGGTYVFEAEKEIDLTVPAGKNEELTYQYDNNLPNGEYIATVEIFSGESLIGREKIIFNILPLSPKVLGTATSLFRQFFQPFVITAAGLALLIWLFKIKQKRIRLYKRLPRLTGLCFLAADFLAVTLLVSGIYVGSRRFNMYREEIQWTNKSENVPQKVKGVVSNPNQRIDEIEFNPKGKNLILFEKASSGSDVAVILKEKTLLTVIDEAAGWYRVLLPDGQHGWVKIGDLGLDY